MSIDLRYQLAEKERQLRAIQTSLEDAQVEIGNLKLVQVERDEEIMSLQAQLEASVNQRENEKMEAERRLEAERVEAEIKLEADGWKLKQGQWAERVEAETRLVDAQKQISNHQLMGEEKDKEITSLKAQLEALEN